MTPLVDCFFLRLRCRCGFWDSKQANQDTPACAKCGEVPQVLALLTGQTACELPQISPPRTGEDDCFGGAKTRWRKLDGTIPKPQRKAGFASSVSRRFARKESTGSQPDLHGPGSTSLA